MILQINLSWLRLAHANKIGRSFPIPASLGDDDVVCRFFVNNSGGCGEDFVGGRATWGQIEVVKTGQKAKNPKTEFGLTTNIPFFITYFFT